MRVRVAPNTRMTLVQNTFSGKGVPVAKRKKKWTKRTVTVANWRRVCTRLQRLENANRKLRKRLQKAGW